MKFTIAGLRVNAGKTQKELADDLGVSVNTVCNWEQGKCMKIKSLAKVVDYFGVSLADIDLTPFVANEDE